jgi:hypothetical protein
MAATQYEIVVRGRLGNRLERLLDGFEVISTDSGCTHLVGWTPDQAALHGALHKIADFGLELVSLRSMGE